MDTTASEAQLKKFVNLLAKFDGYRYDFDKRQHQKQLQARVIADWQLIAKVLDIVIGFVFFLVALVLSVVVIVMSRSTTPQSTQ